MRWQELRAPGRGIQLHVRQVVDPPAPPILLLHGLGVGGAVWQAFARRLLPTFAAIAPDLRGHGASDAPASGYEPADYAMDLAELLAALLPAAVPVPVVGHSLGALVGLALADLRPELVSWLVMMDPPLDPTLSNPEVPEVYRLRRAPHGALERYLLARNPGGGELLANTLARLFRQASDAAFEALLQSGDQLGGRPAVAESAWQQAARIEQPVLVLQADPERGGVLGDAAACALADRLRHRALRKIVGATHALHASHPTETAEAILSFAAYASSVTSGS